MNETELACAEKLAFNAKTAAEGAAVYAKHQHGASLKVYSCRHCRRWHLASA